jgi:hypothetical protein
MEQSKAGGLPEDTDVCCTLFPLASESWSVQFQQFHTGSPSDCPPASSLPAITNSQSREQQRQFQDTSSATSHPPSYDACLRDILDGNDLSSFPYQHQQQWQGEKLSFLIATVTF